MRIIGIMGKKRVGKDTVANFLEDYLISKNKTVSLLSFASPIYDIGSSFEWRGIKYFKDKELINPDWGMSWRQFAQNIGDLFRQGFRSDTFIKIMELKLKEDSESYTDYTIISDIRFQNEYEMIKNWEDKMKADIGSCFIEVQRNTGLIDNHESEQLNFKNIDQYKVDHTILNTGSLEELEEMCKRVVNNIENIF